MVSPVGCRLEVDEVSIIFLPQKVANGSNTKAERVSRLAISTHLAAFLKIIFLLQRSAGK